MNRNCRPARTANRHAVARFRNRIADPEFREERFTGQIFQPEGLLAAELAAQAALPVDRRKIGGRIACARTWVPCSAFSRASGVGVRFSSQHVPFG